MEGQPSVFLTTGEQPSRSAQSSAVGVASSGGGGGGGGGKPASKWAGSDVSATASVESVTAGVTSLAGMSSSGAGISGSTAGTKRIRSNSAEGFHRGIAEAVLMVQKGKLPKLDPLEDQVKAEYARYREDVTRRALCILTDELPRRIASFLKVVDVNAPPGTMLVCDDLTSPPVQQGLLSEERLKKLRTLAAAAAADADQGSAAATPSGGEARTVAAEAAAQKRPPFARSEEETGKRLDEKQQPETHQQHEKEKASVSTATAAEDVEVLSAHESEQLTNWLEAKVNELFSPSAKPLFSQPETAAAAVTGVEAPAAAADLVRRRSSSAESSSGHSSDSSSSGNSSGSSGENSSRRSGDGDGDDGSSSSSKADSSRGSERSSAEKLAAKREGDGGAGERQTTCQQLAAQAAFVKKEAVAMRELLNAVKLFMQLHVPRIEDGNNFGVAIQEEAIHLLNRVEESAFNLYDTVMKYFLARAKLCSKLVKYPNIMDYQLAIIELDRKEWIHLKITKLDLRNNYIMLYDLICKNWQNVVAPKGRHYTATQASLMY